MDYGVASPEVLDYDEGENSTRHDNASAHPSVNAKEGFSNQHRPDLVETRANNDEDLDGIDLYNDVEPTPSFNQGSSIQPSKPSHELHNNPGMQSAATQQMQQQQIMRPEISSVKPEAISNTVTKSKDEKDAVLAKPPEGEGNTSSEGTMLFIGELQWWTTDAELEAALSEYGRIKELKFFEEKASGKSKGYCQVEFVDGNAARACKENMSGRVFNGRACVVAFASPSTIKHLIASQHNAQAQANRKDQSGGIRGKAAVDSGMPFGGRGGNAPMFPPKPGMAMPGRGSVPGGISNVPGGRGMEANARGAGGRGGVRAPGRGNLGVGMPFGPQGGPPPLGGPMGMPGMLPGGFDPAFAPMGGRGFGMGPGGYPRAGPYPGLAPGMGGFPGMGPGLPGVAPHLNPAFFGRGGGMGPGGAMGPGGMVEGQPGGWDGAGAPPLMWNEEGRGEKMGGSDFDSGGDSRMRSGGKGKRGSEGEGGNREDDWERNRGSLKDDDQQQQQWGNSNNAEDDFSGKRRRER